MKNNWFQKVLCMILSVTMLLSLFGISTSAASLKENPEDKHPFEVPSLEDMQSLVGTLTYAEYIETFGALPVGPYTLAIENITDPVAKTTDEIISAALSEHVKQSKLEDPDAWVNFGEENYEDTIYLPSTGTVTWKLDVDESEAGLYFLKIEYFSCQTDESSVSAIERGFLIDGKVPFNEVATINLNKKWAFDYSDKVVTEVPGEEDFYDVNYYWENQDKYVKEVIVIEDGVKTVTTYTLSQDIIGNSMAPSAEAFSEWSTYYVQDQSGYHSGYLAFYLADGSHTITFKAERDPVIIKSIEFVPANAGDDELSYEEYLSKYENAESKVPVGGDIVMIEGEFPDLVSDSSVAPTNDNTSPKNFPVKPGTQLYNVIGETGFSAIGQWTAYKFRVTETGFYNFGMRFKQSSLQGMFACRTVKLSGGSYGLADGTPTVPFAEAYSARFDYVEDWQSSFLSDGNVPFMFYFEEGVEYTLYLECSLGALKQYIEVAETALSEVNAAYLKIIQLTGTDPDEYNDAYNFMEIMPEVLITILRNAVELERIHKELSDICGGNGSHIATLQTIYRLFNTAASDQGRNLAANLANVKSYLGTLGTWINDSKAAVVMFDSIDVIPATTDAEGNVVPDESKLRPSVANFFESFGFEFVAFFTSFFTDYDQMGVTTLEEKDTAEHIAVWISAGRDQSQIWRTMIDAQGGFTDKTGIGVSLKLVTGGTLLPSILSRKGPDVFLGQGAAEVINYAIREAVLGINGRDTDLTEEQNSYFLTDYYTYRTPDGGYERTTEYRGEENLSFAAYDYEEATVGNFAEAALDTIRLGGVAYGVPRTMQFSMMFYRMDVLANIGYEVPQSWDDLLSILPVLQSNNMQIGVTYVQALDFMIYQTGGNMWKYTDTEKYDPMYAGARIDLDSNIALETFDFTCRLFSDYSFPVSFSGANRFRTGEMPIFIGSYADVYNQLIIYATEISGLWKFCSLPGSFRADGTFNYNSLAQVSATTILNGADKRGNLLPAWLFVQWETAAEQSSEYGNRIVAIIGQSAKYETANLHSINNLSWTASEKAAIMNQMDHMSSIVNYPGSYIISRYLNFAFLDAVNEGANAVDALSSYIDAINAEIARKRAEFGLWVPADPEDEPPMLTD